MAVDATQNYQERNGSPTPGSSPPQRTRSLALSRLRRRDSTRTNDSTSSTGSVPESNPRPRRFPARSTPSIVRMSSSTSHAQSLRGHGYKASSASVSAASLGAPPNPTTTRSSRSSNVGSTSDKSASIEQSVRKFRVFEALRSGDTAAISKAIRESAAGPNSTNGSLEDTTILHLAIQCAEQPVVEFVLAEAAGALDLNARDKDGNTPLHIAAAQGRGQVVRLLLEQEGINDSIANYQGRLPLDLARTPDIFQQLQLSRSLFVDAKITQIQELVAQGDYKTLGEVLEEPRVKTVCDINGGMFTSDITTIQSGGTLLHEAARKKNTQLIQVLLLHGADPFRRDRRGRLPQDVTKDDNTKAMLKKSPAAVAAQRGIQEKAVLGNVSQTNVGSAAPGDNFAAKEGREMKGYLKKWTNYRKGYQLRWFVLEDGVLSYYKHQDDAGSACRGAINMRIAKLNMDPTEKTKFEILGKSSVKYHLKANHEVEAKRWFWALNNSIQWTKDQAKEEERQRSKSAEMLRQAKAEVTGSKDDEGIETPNGGRLSMQSSRQGPAALTKSTSQRVAFAAPSESALDDDEGTYGSYEPSFVGEVGRVPSHLGGGEPGANADGDDEEYGDDSSTRDAPASKDAFDITAQSAKLQLDMMSQVHAALQSQTTKSPTMPISDPTILQAIATYDGAIRSLKGLVGDLLKISRDRDSYWQYRLDREADMRRMWEESMAQVAREQEELQAKMGESELKRKKTKRALREVMNSATTTSRPVSEVGSDVVETLEKLQVDSSGNVLRHKSTATSSLRRRSIIDELGEISATDSEEDDEEFFDAVDAGEVEVGPLPEVPTQPEQKVPTSEKKQMIPAGGLDISKSFLGYEDGIRHRLKMDADNRPKISLWGILKSMIGKDMTKMTLPVSFNEPTSLLYRCAEDMEYTELLDRAAERSDSLERMVYVAAFAASEYASTIGRVAKPFNPLLGETFEYARPDRNFRFFIEQVSHHPPIGAAWAESPQWTYYGESAVQSKFYGKSFDVVHLGTWFLRLRPSNGGKEELYTWKKVMSSVVGIITGNPTIDNYGPMEVKNWSTGEVCHIDFKPRGWKASSAYQVSGRVNNADGKPHFSIGGKWNSRLYARLTPGYQAADMDDPKSVQQSNISDPNQAFLVWQANPRPPNIPFNLTPFVLTFNDLPDKLRPYLPPTDSRLRPDQRAMEDGEYDLAATEKNRVENRQRATRRKREAAGEEFVPKWFHKTKCPITGVEYWEYNGKYWETRDKAGHGDEKAWEGIEDIFGLFPDEEEGEGQK